MKENSMQVLNGNHSELGKNTSTQLNKSISAFSVKA
jgi:hypothetical protein